MLLLFGLGPGNDVRICKLAIKQINSFSLPVYISLFISPLASIVI
jgi:hypothetical protein